VISSSHLHFVSLASLIIAMIVYCVYTGAYLGADRNTSNGVEAMH